MISGKVDFTGLTRLPVSLFTPGIMGWYRFIPFMQCYHGLISMNHSLEGEITDGAERIVLSGGKGYIEKDWGSSFPRMNRSPAVSKTRIISSRSLPGKVWPDR
jgi:hypothetical protein